MEKLTKMAWNSNPEIPAIINHAKILSKPILPPVSTVESSWKN